MQDEYDAGYLPDDADCDQDIVRFHIGAANEFHNDIHEQREQVITQLRERVKELEECLGTCDGYLDTSSHATIGHMSLLHRDIKQLRKGGES